MWPKVAIAGAIVLASLLELFLLIQLVLGLSAPMSGSLWTLLHVFASVVGAVAMSFGIQRLLNCKLIPLIAFSFCMGLFMPFVGLVGGSAALFYGVVRSLGIHREEEYWQFTENPELPFTTPIHRELKSHDGRGFTEQLTYGTDSDDLYRKVLAAANIKAALSVDALKAAIKHPDERIRLTAYQTIDRKINNLNKEIQNLETAAMDKAGIDKANTWLQIASNYWELLVLEKDEPIARKQLLEKASAAANRAIEVLHDNRNAHFILGRISLLQGKYDIAQIAFQESIELGMPKEKAMPYLAESAYARRDFKKVREVLDSIDGAFKKYPPLKGVAEYWA